MLVASDGSGPLRQSRKPNTGFAQCDDILRVFLLGRGEKMIREVVQVEESGSARNRAVPQEVTAFHGCPSRFNFGNIPPRTQRTQRQRFDTGTFTCEG